MSYKAPPPEVKSNQDFERLVTCFEAQKILWLAISKKAYTTFTEYTCWAHPQPKVGAPRYPSNEHPSRHTRYFVRFIPGEIFIFDCDDCPGMSIIANEIDSNEILISKVGVQADDWSSTLWADRIKRLAWKRQRAWAFLPLWFASRLHKSNIFFCPEVVSGGLREYENMQMIIYLALVGHCWRLYMGGMRLIWPRKDFTVTDWRSFYRLRYVVKCLTTHLVCRYSMY